MKVYSIGRESGCNIVIQDNTNVISRRHAILNVSPSGKMTIVDQSQNGTYVNGIRISSNVPVPVTRKDNVSFAHIAKLDWNQVPKSSMMSKYIYIALVVLIVIIGGVVGLTHFDDNGGGSSSGSGTVAADSSKTEKPKTEKEIRKEIQDSLKLEQAKKDSIEKVKNDSINKVRRQQQQQQQNESQGSNARKPKKDTTKVKKDFRI